jgi:hypothetical protein
MELNQLGIFDFQSTSAWQFPGWLSSQPGQTATDDGRLVMADWADYLARIIYHFDEESVM